MQTKLAIITGGSKGLGFSLVKTYCEKEFQVISISRSKPKFTHLNLLAKITFDLSEIKEFESLEKKLFNLINIKTIQEVILINNAGTLGNIKTNENNTIQNINNTINLNLTAPIVLTAIVTKRFKNIRTSVYNISSGAAVNAYYGWSNYCATKAGLALATKTIALEQEKNSTFEIYSIIPGIIDTDMQTEIRKSKKSDFEQVERFIQLKEENLLVAPDVVANKIYSIRSKNYKSGITIDIKDLE